LHPLIIECNLPENFTLVDGLSIRHWTNQKAPEAGKPAIVLFHGNAFSLDNWKSIGTFEALSKLGNAVFAIDLPVGRGSKSQKISESSFKSYSQIVPWLEKIFVSLGIAEGVPMALVGPSLGGGVAVSFALAHASRISALILVSPALGKLSAGERERISELDMPVLLVWGDRDNVFPVSEFGKPLKDELPHSKLLILKQAGHAAYLDKPDEFNEIVCDFLSEVQ
jgi:abhydrolase domain-containing protein 14